MNTFTIVATGQTTKNADEVETEIRSFLEGAGFTLVECGWAPDVDTILDNVKADELALIDLN